MKKVWILLLLAAGLEAGCSGSGAVNPLTPANQTKQDASTSAEDSDVVYWTSFPVTFTMTDPLNGVCLINKKLGWACGNNGSVLKWDGETWSKVDTGLAKNENLMAVAFANENEGWAVGTHGVILHYQNGGWNLDNSPTQETLYSLAVTPSRTVWVMGSNGAILNYNGLTWGTVYSIATTVGAPTTVTDDLYGIGLYGQNSGWAAGNRGVILGFDGQKWTPFSPSPTTERLNSVSVINEVEAWMVGAFGTLLRYNGTTWSKVTSAFSGFDFYDVVMKSSDDGWAVGQDGTIIFYDGSRWISHQKPEGKPSLNSLAFYKDVGFMVGQNGAILKFQPNGEMAKFSFLFKGEAKAPTKSNPFWTVTYMIMNQSPKASPLVTFELPVPKGLEPFLPKPTPSFTPGGSASSLSPVPTSAITSTPTPTSTATPTATATAPAGAEGKNPSVLSTPAPPSKTPSGAPLTASAVTGEWKLKDGNVEWEIGNISSSEMKTVTVLLQNKKGEKKEYPVVLKGVLKSLDKVMAEASPVTMIAAEPKPGAPAPAKPGAAAAANGPATGGADSSQKGGSSNAQPAPAAGN